MKKCNRFLALFLTLVLLTGLVSAAEPLLIAAAPQPVDKATAQKAIIATALAYYDKGLPVQYDSNSVNLQNKNDFGGACRLTSGDSPEQGGYDHTIYSVCSDYCYDVYLNTFGYQLMGTPRMCRTSPMTELSAKEPIIAYKYDSTGKDPDAVKDLDKAMKEARAILEPGDVVVGYGDSGHAMLYIGDYKGDGKEYIIHCWGGKYDGKTGVDTVEGKGKVKNANPEGGAIRIDEVNEALFAEDGSGVWGLRNEKHAKVFVIMRPLNDPALAKPELTDAAKTRLQFPGIEVSKEPSPGNRYFSVESGDEITLTVTVTNNSDADYKGITVTELLPTGAELKEGSITADGKCLEDVVTWETDVAAGKSAKLSFTVTVTAKRGEKVEFPSGAVENLITRSFAIPVAGKSLSADKVDKLERLAGGLDEPDGTGYADLKELQFLNKFYADFIGVELNLPEKLNDYIEGLCEKTQVVGVSEKQEGWMWVPKDESTLTDTYQLIRAMTIPEHLVGYAVYLEGCPTEARDDWSMVNRVSEYKTGFYQPGDIFFGLCDPDVKTLSKPENMVAYIYLGDGMVAMQDADNGIAIADFSSTVQCLLNKNFILGLRPSLAYDDVNAALGAKLPFTDVKEADWFYPFVKELYAAKIVSGMTDTTFVPGGKLTYGQALKLIVCGLGKGEQPAGTHWASGYLTFAKEQKWLDRDVDLNGEISRLAFCQIAAKAKGLTAQPAANPFTDCSDPDVLALVNAGIINGMTATTFEPNTILTRAQISKIISGLIK